MILCGGQGTRLREETEYRPKPMVEIGGRPILWHIMKIYGANAVRRFVLCLGYKGWEIKEFFLRQNEMSRDFTLSTNGSHPARFHDEASQEDWEVTLAETGDDTATGARKTFALGKDQMCGEAVFAPREGATAEGDGYLVMLAYDAPANVSELMIFEALEVDRGPVATAKLPIRIPAGFHGTFVSRT